MPATDYDIVSVDVQGSAMDVFLFIPSGNTPLPGIVLAQHIPVGHAGIENDTFTLETARRFAANGYVIPSRFLLFFTGGLKLILWIIKKRKAGMTGCWLIYLPLLRCWLNTLT